MTGRKRRGPQQAVPIDVYGHAVCPFCGQKVEFGWDKEGRLKYWEPKNACGHFAFCAAGIHRDYAVFEG